MVERREYLGFTPEPREALRITDELIGRRPELYVTGWARERLPMRKTMQWCQRGRVRRWRLCTREMTKAHSNSNPAPESVSIQ
jgi:hypothetical protein